MGVRENQSADIYMTNQDTIVEVSKGQTAPPPPSTAENGVNLSPLFVYLQSEQGHEMTSRVLQLIEGIKKTTLDKSLSQAKFNRWMEAGVILVVLVAVCALSYLDKLNPTVGVVLGSVVGYFFGKNK
jgi:hypothetical protein